MDLLTEIGIKYGTDKATHHQFTPFYNKYFGEIRHKVKNILEIGVLNNASLKMWEEYFPNANIVGIDNRDRTEYTSDRIKIHIVDQSNSRQLTSVINQYDDFDIIIDDGSHLVPHQYISLATLLPYVKGGGFYIVEDLHCSYFPKWQEWYDPTVEVTMLESIQSLAYSLNFRHQYITQKEACYIQSNTSWVEIFDRTGEYDSITSIIKKI